MQILTGLIGVLVGGLIAAAGQWFITPHVQRRIRNESRVEELLLELVTLVNETIPAAAQDLHSAAGVVLHLEKRIVSESWDVSTPPAREFRDRLYEDFDAACGQWDAAVGWRVDWLFDRLGQRYGLTHRKFRLQTYDVPSMRWQLEGLTIEQLDERWDAERTAHAEMIKVVNALVDEHVPGIPGTPYVPPSDRPWSRFARRMGAGHPGR